MGRIKKGVVVSREYKVKPTSGQRFGYRHDLVDWLNRARTGPARDRETAERVGALIAGMNDAALRFSSSWKKYMSWRLAGTEDACWGTPVPESDRIYLKTLRGVSPDYKPEVDLKPSFDGDKWELVFHCDVPSGEGTQIQARWGGESDDNPESQAIEAIIFIALDGQLGTIRRCEVGSCGKWFLTKDDPRVRCCPDHDVDDLRSGTEKRNSQVKAAAKRARTRAKAEDEQYWTRRRQKNLVRPTRRAKN
jgi:hypothetical protein